MLAVIKKIVKKSVLKIKIIAKRGIQTSKNRRLQRGFKESKST